MKKSTTYQKGFSLVEITIVAGIASMMTLAVINFFGGFEKLKRVFVEKADTVLSEKVAYAFLLKDLSYSSVSLNYINLKATKTTGNCPSDNFWTLSKDLQHSGCSVEFVLNSPNQMIYIIYQREAFTLNINPEVFYRASSSSLNIDYTLIKQFLDTKGLTRKNSLYKLESPNFMENKDTGLYENYGMLAFAGGPEGLERVVFKDAKVGAMIPLSKNLNCKATTNDLDGYLRCLPRQGDSATFNLKPIEVVRYRLQKQEGADIVDLWRSRMKINSKGEVSYSELRVGEKVKQITLRRQSVTKPNVSFNIELM